MKQYIDKSAAVAEFNRLIAELVEGEVTMFEQGRISAFEDAKLFLDTLEVKDPYENCVQYPSIKDGIEAHAETYSFNIESQLFPQLTKEQQALWRKEIEQACISGGDAGVTLARDQRYKENLEVKEVDLKNEITQFLDTYFPDAKLGYKLGLRRTAKYFFELGIKTKGE